MEMKRCDSCFREYEGTLCPHCGGIQNDPHQLPVGTLLRDRYKLGRVLGQGGFGITYLGWDTLMHKYVAVKEFYPSGTVFRRTTISTKVQCDTQTMIPHFEYSKERFLREASTLVKFKDVPEVVDILDLLKENNTTYIVMEFVRGVDLAKYIRMKGGRLSVEETFRILRPVMEALAKVHRGGIIHRDISPDNIILDPMGGAKLLDFGAVRAVEDPDVDKGLNKSTEAILKHGFAPIEQYNTRGSLGPWTDEYAMCATVWYCLTGKIPEEASIRISEGIDPDWSTIPGLPEHQQAALTKGMACRAKDRYRSLDELLAELFPEETVHEIPVPVPADEPPVHAVPEIQDTPKKSGKKGWIWAIPAVLVILIAVGIFIYTKSKPEKPQPGGTVLQGGISTGTLPTDDTTTPADESTEPVDEPTEPMDDPTEPMDDPTEPVDEPTKPQEDPPAPEETESTIQTRPPTEPEETEPLSPEEKAYREAEALLDEGKLGKAAIAFGKLGNYSDARDRSFALWAQITERDIVSAGMSHTVGITVDGTAVAAGWVGDGRCDVNDWTDLVAISAGDYHTVGLKADGTVVAVGWNDFKQCDVSSWTDIVAISAGYAHTVGLRADGTVVTTNSAYGDVSKWTNIVAIAAGADHTVGLKATGKVVAAGSTGDGRCDVDDWTGIVAISASDTHTVGLKVNGTVVATGSPGDGRCDVSGWTDIVAISAGSTHTEALRADGTVVTTKGSLNGVNEWSDIVAISAGFNHVIGVKADGTVFAVGDNSDGRCNARDWRNILPPKERVPFY